MYTPYTPLDVPALGDETYDYEENGTNETVSAEQIGTANIVKGVALSCCAFCAFLGNLLVIVAVVSTKRLQTITNLFVVSLAVADMAVSVLVLPLSILIEITGRWIFDHIVCDIWISSDVMLCTASILNLCAISVDRYLAITRPLKYAARRSKRTATLMILCAWLLSFIITAPPILGWHESDRGEQEGVCQLTKNPGYIVFSALGSFFLPAAVMIAIYVRIFYVAYRREKTFVSAFRTHHSTLRRLTTKMSISETASSFRHDEDTVSTCSEARVKRVRRGREPSSQNPFLSPSSIDSRRASCAIETLEMPSPSPPPRGVSDMLRKLRCTPSIVYVIAASKLRRSTLSDTGSDPDASPTRRTLPAPSSNQKLVTFTQQSRRRSTMKTSDVAHIAVGNDSQANSSSHTPTFIEVICTPPEECESNNVSATATFSSQHNPPSPVCTCKSATLNVNLNANKDALALDDDACSSRRSSVDTRRSSDVSNGHSANPAIRSARSSEFRSSRIDRSVSARLRARQEILAMRQQRKEKAILRTENKTAQTLAVVMGCFVISWSPFFITYLIKPFCGCHVPESVEALITWLGYCNSLCNPFIYGELRSGKTVVCGTDTDHLQTLVNKRQANVRMFECSVRLDLSLSVEPTAAAIQCRLNKTHLRLDRLASRVGLGCTTGLESACECDCYCDCDCEVGVPGAFYNKDFLNAFVRIIRQILCIAPKEPVRPCLRSRKSNVSTNSHSE